MSMKRWCIRKIASLRSKILREKASPEYIARGWGLGMFCGCLLPFGGQLIVSIPVSFLIKGSKIGAVLGTLITNHVTIFFIYPAQCYVGNLLMGGDLTFGKIKEVMADVLKHQSWSSLFSLGWELVAAFFIGGALLTVIMTPITYFFVLHLVRRYRARREKMLARKAAERAAGSGATPPAV